MPNQFTIYRSTDASAPVLSGTAGALTTVLDAILVNGYGSKAAAGWGIDYTATNIRAYKAPSGARMAYYIGDDATWARTGPAKAAVLLGCVTITGAGVATGLFPVANTIVEIYKSGTASATARAWIAFADARTLYLAIDGNAAGYNSFVAIGEIESFVASDLYNGITIGNVYNVDGSVNLFNVSLVSVAATGHYMARGFTGMGVAVNVGKHGDHVKGQASMGSAGSQVTFPNASDGGLYLSPLWVTDPTTGGAFSVRGRMRGLWQACHAGTNYTNGDVLTGAGALAGKTFLFVKDTVNNSYVFETSATLATN